MLYPEISSKHLSKSLNLKGTNPMRRAQLTPSTGAEIDSIFGDDDEEETAETTMVGVDVSARGDEVAVVVGELTANPHHFGSKCATSFNP